MTVNHRDAGSSPAWGAIIESPFRESLKRGFFVLRLVPFTFPILVKQTDWCYILFSPNPPIRRKRHFRHPWRSYVTVARMRVKDDADLR